MEHYKWTGVYLPNGIEVWISDEFEFGGETCRQIYSPGNNVSLFFSPKQTHEDIFIKGPRDLSMPPSSIFVNSF